MTRIGKYLNRTTTNVFDVPVLRHCYQSFHPLLPTSIILSELADGSISVEGIGVLGSFVSVKLSRICT